MDSLNYNEKNTGFYYHPGHIWPLQVKGLTKISFLGEQIENEQHHSLLINS
jgi:hypothetical protein